MKLNYYLDFVYITGLIIIMFICIYVNLQTDSYVLDKKKIILFFSCEMINFYIIGNLICKNNITYILVPFCLGLALSIIIFKDNKINVVVAYLISISIFQMINMITHSISLLIYVNLLMNKKYILILYNILKIIFIGIIISMCYIFRNVIKNIEDVLNFDFKGLGILGTFVIMMLTINILIYRGFFVDMLIVRIITMITFGIIALSLLIQSINIEKKVEMTSNLSKQLKIKNNELRKIRHDYGAQISYLYGLYLLKRWDSLKEALNNIIETNNSISNSLLFNKREDSKIIEAMDKLLKKGVHIIVEETEDIEIIENKHKDLLIIIKNTCESIINIMGEKCILKIKTYIKRDKFIIVFESIKFKHTDKRGNRSIKKELKILLKDVSSMVNNNGKMYIRNSENVLQVKIKLTI